MEDCEIVTGEVAFCGVCVTFDVCVLVITCVVALNAYDEGVEDCGRVDGVVTF